MDRACAVFLIYCRFLRLPPTMAPSFSSTTPPMASTDRRDSCDSYDSDSYFSKTYVPLSNLPTPPLSFHSSNSSRDTIPILDLHGDLDPSLLGTCARHSLYFLYRANMNEFQGRHVTSRTSYLAAFLSLIPTFMLYIRSWSRLPSLFPQSPLQSAYLTV
jgi:hypothetical protein